MSISSQTRNAYDAGTSLLLELFASPYLNLGWWDRQGLTFSEAQQGLVSLFGDFSQLGPGLRVIDAGCGTGEQDLFFMDRYDCASILGINISSVQVEMARDSLRAYQGRANRLEFRCLDATDLSDISMNAWDRMIALEAVNFFQDKPRFLRETFRVLKKGGILSIVGHVPLVDFSSSAASVYEEFRHDLGEQRDLLANDEARCLLAIRSAFEHEQSLRRKFRESYLPLEKLLATIQECGFSVEEVRDGTKQSMGFYPALKVRMRQMFESVSSGHPEQEKMKSMLLALFIGRYYLYLKGTAGYFLIRSKK